LLARRSISPFISASILLIATALHAQSSGGNGWQGRLYRISHGYLEVTREGNLTQVARYNDSLRFEVAAAAPVLGLDPIDLALTPPSPAPDRALLLAAPFGHSSIYSINLTGTPSFFPLWESTLPPMRRIVAVDDFAGDGTQALAAVGDSAFVVVGLNGQERYRLQGDMIDAVACRSGSYHFIVIERDGENILLIPIDPRTGSAIDRPKSLPGSGDPLVRIVEGSKGDELVLVTTGRRSQAYFLDPNNLAILRDPLPLPSEPVALLPYEIEGIPGLAALFADYPAPTLLPLVAGARMQKIDYPLQGVLESAATSSRLNALLTRDSIAFYDREMRLLSIAPSPGTNQTTIQELDSIHLLASSPGGSRIFTVDLKGGTWLGRNWLSVAVVAASALLLALVIAAGRRYRFARILYNNLVRVKNSQGVIVMSQTQRVRHLNMSARGMLDIAPYIPLGRHVSEYLKSDEHRPLFATLRRLFADGEEFETRIDMARDGQVRALMFRGRPMFGQYGFTAGYLLLVNDITQTLERERLVNWASVAHHIAHEMKTPLGTVRMTAEMLHDRLGSNGHGSDDLRATNRIIKQSERLREIVEDLLTVARTESLQPVQADLKLLVTSLAQDYSDTLPRSIELRLELNGDDFRTSIDVGQLTVALRNLLDNAWQAIGNREGGLILMTVSESEREFEIVVEDNGRGMSQTTLTKLFQPFYTEREGGSGIGTVIVKRVIEAHGGSVRVESEPGKGTRFVLTIPR
jgi:signal transduction histidine kinase